MSKCLVAAMFVSTLLLAACAETPTVIDKPDIVTTAGIDTLRIGVEQLLPTGLSATTDSMFRVSVGSDSTRLNLAQLCSSCRALHGTVATKPAFFDSSSLLHLRLPPQVKNVTICCSSHLNYLYGSTFSFDPMHPRPDTTGQFIIRMFSGGNPQLNSSYGSPTLSSSWSWTGQPRLYGGAPTASIDVRIALQSPGGTAVRIDTTEYLRFFVEGRDVFVSRAQITVVDRPVAVEPVRIQFQAIGHIEQIRRGTLYLDIANPFEMVGALTVQICDMTGNDTCSGAPIVIAREIPLSPGHFETDVALSADLTQALARANYPVIAVSGRLNGVGDVTVQPRQAIRIVSRLEIHTAGQ